MTDSKAAAHKAWLKLRRDVPSFPGTPQAMLDAYFGIPLRQLPSDEWKVGDTVRYVRSSDWAFSKGTVGRIVSISDPGRKPHEYQVFHVVPNGSKHAPCWWTTPDDVEFVSRG